jgi:hypothetical protein
VTCATPLSIDELVAYRRSELEEPAERALESHFFSCAHCAGRLTWVEGLEDAVATAMRQGLFDVYVTRKTVERLERAGSVVRKYDIAAGQSINCTIAPDDDMTVVSLHSALRPGVPVTVAVEFLDHGSGQRMEELRPAFQDQETGEVIVRLAGEIQRMLGSVRVTLNLRFGEGAAVETVGPFEMNHSPWNA